MRISEMAWVACALHRITLLLTLQGGSSNKHRTLLKLQGESQTSNLRSFLMQPMLPRPCCPTFLRCQDLFQRSHRLRCYHRQSLCRPQLVPPNHKFCNPPLCRELRKNLQVQFLRSSLAPRLWNGQNLFVFVSHLTRLLRMCRLLLLLHLPLPGRLGHANKRCLRHLPRPKHAGVVQSPLLPPPHEFLRFHLPPQFFHLLPLLLHRRLVPLPLPGRAPASVDAH